MTEQNTNKTPCSINCSELIMMKIGVKWTRVCIDNPFINLCPDPDRYKNVSYEDGPIYDMLSSLGFDNSNIAAYGSCFWRDNGFEKLKEILRPIFNYKRSVLLDHSTISDNLNIVLGSNACKRMQAHIEKYNLKPMEEEIEEQRIEDEKAEIKENQRLMEMLK